MTKYNALAPTPAADKENRGELDCIRIEPAENGYCVTASYEPDKPPSQKVPFPQPETRVFTDRKQMLAFINTLCEQQEQWEEDEE